MGLPSRLKAIKKNSPSAATAKKADAEEGKEKRRQGRRFRPSVIAKRREAYYTTGKGSVGLVVRYPRLVRYVRKIRKEQNLRYEQLTGSAPSDSKKIVIFKSFPNTAIGAIDAYANRIMEFAAAHASDRKSKKEQNGKEKKVGLKLKKKDIEFAVYWIKRLTSE